MAAVAAVASVGAHSAWAAPLTWTGIFNTDWGTPVNWSPAQTPALVDDATFPAVIPATGATITVPFGSQINNLVFNNSYTLTGGNLSFGANQNITVGAGLTATIDSSLLDGSGATSYLKKQGAGTLVLSGNNSGYNRWMDVIGGTVRVVNGAAVPGGPFYFHVTNAGAVVQLQGGVTTPGGNTIYLTGVAVNDNPSFQSVSGVNTWGGTLVLHGGDGDHNVGADLGSTLIVQGPVNQSGGPDNLVKVGGGTLVLQGVGNYTGVTRIKAGTLQLDNAAAIQQSTLDMNAADSGSLTFGAPAAFTLGGLTGSRNLDMGGKNLSIGNSGQSTAYSGQLSGGALVKIGAGTLTLSGANSYTGGTTVSAGTLALAGGNDRLAPAGNLTITGGVLDLGGFTQNNSAAVSFQGGTVQNGTIQKSGSDYDGRAGTVSATLAGAVGLTKTTAGTLVLSGPNTYTGLTTVSAGFLNIQHGSALGAVAAGTTVPSAGQLQIQNNITVSGELLTLDGASGAAVLRNISGDNIWAGPVSVQSFSAIQVDSGSLNISGPITSNSRINKNGAGTLILSGNNSAATIYLDLNAGMVVLADNNAMVGTGGNRYIHVTNAGATLALRGGVTIGPNAGTPIAYLSGVPSNDNPALKSLSGVNTWNGNVVLHNGGSTTTTVDRNIGADAGSTLIITGTVSQSLGAGELGRNFVKVGDGTVVLQGAATYTGSTMVKAGTLLIDGAHSRPVTVLGGMLGGSGTISNNVDVQSLGTASGGDFIGRLTINGAYTQAGTLLAQLGGFTQTSQYDLVQVTGPAALDGTVMASLVNNFQPQAGVFDILTATGGITDNGLALAWAPAQLLPAQSWSYRITTVAGLPTLQLQLSVPEPASLVLLALGAGALALLGWRRRTVRGG